MITPVLPTYARADLEFVKGKGAWLTEADGSHFLDLASGIAVNSLGHAHPDLVKIIKSQAEKLWHVSNLYEIPQQRALAEILVENSFADTVFFTNSGTESCELAVKMARKYWFEKGYHDKFEIITFEGSFHGRSSAGIAATASEKMTKGFGPLLPGFLSINWNNHEAIKNSISDRTAAILLEPIQGEGGIRVVPEQCLKGIREFCDENKILLILDEVQCGVGRTGKLFAHEWAEIEPDIMMVAKGIGGGFPLGAVLAKENAASGMTAGTHGSTYGGNPLGCSIGLKVMDIISNPNFLLDVNHKAKNFRAGLSELLNKNTSIFEEVRGKGLMLGLKCKVQNIDVVNAGYSNKLLTVPAGDNVVRLLPPLTISDKEIKQALEKLDCVMTELS
ncbi:MAG: aspartate aminotransferase family protein [Paracoccaceae bacterium]|jgi:acetylornithine/N-succinyldiaminopimelate aminotransferase|nr:MAG: aspartate aminotransferase family protein [Paracoccaceae bacterium]|tara:strand:+ start:3058 stop:4227 length:1170 start_codon:yes stop_codon:yes gene_type:complete